MRIKTLFSVRSLRCFSVQANISLKVVLDYMSGDLGGKSSQEHLVNAEFPEDSILGPILFLPYINDLPNDVICDFATYTDDTTLYSKCDQASDMTKILIGF